MYSRPKSVVPVASLGVQGPPRIRWRVGFRAFSSLDKEPEWDR